MKIIKVKVLATSLSAIAIVSAVSILPASAAEKPQQDIATSISTSYLNDSVAPELDTLMKEIKSSTNTFNEEITKAYNEAYKLLKDAGFSDEIINSILALSPDKIVPIEYINTQKEPFPLDRTSIMPWLNPDLWTYTDKYNESVTARSYAYNYLSKQGYSSEVLDYIFPTNPHYIIIA